MSFFKKDKEEEVETTCIMSTGNSSLVAVIKSILMDAGIPFIVKNEYTQNLFGFGNIGGLSNPISGSMEVRVRKEDEEVAMELIKDLE